MRTAPPAAAVLARLAEEVQRARRAPACARALPCCAYTHPQVATAASVININQAHKLLKLTSKMCHQHRLGFECCWAAAGITDTLHERRIENGRAAAIIIALEQPPWQRGESSSLASGLSSSILLCM